jgi:hypothetical protein
MDEHGDGRDRLTVDGVDDDGGDSGGGGGDDDDNDDDDDGDDDIISFLHTEEMEL